MRQRLTEITGLSSETVSQLAQMRRRKRHRAYDPGIDYDAMPDYSDYHQPQAQDMYVPQQERTPKKPGAGGKKWDKKPWDKNGKRGGDRDRQRPRTPIGVEPPTLTALRTLLHHPQLARARRGCRAHRGQKMRPTPSCWWRLLEALQKNPQLEFVAIDRPMARH